MRFGGWYAIGAFAAGIGVGKLHRGEAMIPAWASLAIGAAVCLGVIVASIVSAIREARRKSTETVVVEGPQTRRWLASKLQIRVVTTTLKDVEKQ